MKTQQMIKKIAIVTLGLLCLPYLGNAQVIKLEPETLKDIKNLKQTRAIRNPDKADKLLQSYNRRCLDALRKYQRAYKNSKMSPEDEDIKQQVKKTRNNFIKAQNDFFKIRDLWRGPVTRFIDTPQTAPITTSVSKAASVSRESLQQTVAQAALQQIPLESAIATGSWTVVQYWLNQGTPVEEVLEASLSQPRFVQRLLNLNPQVKGQVEEYSREHMMTAVRKGYRGTLRILCDNFPLRQHEANDLLEVALHNKRWKIAEDLIKDRGAVFTDTVVVGLINTGDAEGVIFAIEHGVDPNKPLELLGKNPLTRKSPLIHLAWNSHPEMVPALQEHGGDINAQDIDGNTLLHLRALHPQQVKQLLALGANPNVLNNMGFNPVAYAELCLLLKNNPDLDINPNEVVPDYLHLLKFTKEQKQVLKETKALLKQTGLTDVPYPQINSPLKKFIKQKSIRDPFEAEFGEQIQESERLAAKYHRQKAVRRKRGW